MSLKPTPHKAIFLFIFCFINIMSVSQDKTTDSLKNVLITLPDSRQKVQVLLEISQSYINTSILQVLDYATRARDIASKLEYDQGLADSYRLLGLAYKRQGRILEALDAYGASLEILKKMKDLAGQSRILNNLGSLYGDEALGGGSKAGQLGTMAEGQETKAVEYYLQALKLAEQAKDSHRVVIALSNIGVVYLNNPNTYDKALEYLLRALPVAKELKDSVIIGSVTVNIGEIYLSKNRYDSALFYFRQSLTAFEATGDICYTLNDIAKLYTTQQNYDSALIYYGRALTIATNLGAKEDMVGSLLGIAQAYHREGKIKDAILAYKKAEDIGKPLDVKFQLRELYQGLASAYSSLKDYNNAFKYQTLLLDINDSLYSRETDQKLAHLDFTFQIDKKQDNLLKESEVRRQKIARNAVTGGLLLAFIIAFILYRGYRNKVKTNKILDQQLDNLRSAQAQLIQSEKMASLGQLTAGIAHEIQNPLNFVNNFSEVNKELIEELKGEKSKGKNERDEQLENELLNDITQNLEKISHHGKRADAIVRGMLQHSRASSGQRELTDINALADEYLRLAYHGVRAKNNSFDIKLATDFDGSIMKLNIAPQEIGRVILNLINNAFYAVIEKQKQNIPGYQPTVNVTTKRKDGQILLSVADNGSGIPQNIFDKIFQPFFTTKPTGEGTGLGLSLAYDIVKAHGGQISIQTREDEGSEFTIHLPA
jgi:two-component system, NtrC family, sensor kinase